LRYRLALPAPIMASLLRHNQLQSLPHFVTVLVLIAELCLRR
jgi:hypothetical protein